MLMRSSENKCELRHPKRMDGEIQVAKNTALVVAGPAARTVAGSAPGAVVGAAAGSNAAATTIIAGGLVSSLVGNEVGSAIGGAAGNERAASMAGSFGGIGGGIGGSSAAKAAMTPSTGDPGCGKSKAFRFVAGTGVLRNDQRGRERSKGSGVFVVIEKWTVA